jgi:predicted AlkP superfamily phosphohydrolase/phosphomutase
VEARTGKYVIEPGLTGCIVNGEWDKAVRLLFEEIECKARVTRFLMEKYPWDLLVTVFRSTDAVHHCFWKYHDPGHPQFDPEMAKRYGDVILKAYQRIDGFLQEILIGLDQDTLVLVVSDHGCGPKHPASNQLNLWLQSSGYLAYEKIRSEGRAEWTRLLAGVYRWTIAKTPRRAKEVLWRSLPGLRDRVQSRLCFSGIDWARTRAFSDSLFPNIWMNVKGRDPLGIVSPNKEYEDLCAELAARLSGCRDETSGESIVDNVFHRNDIYAGPHADKAPDLLVRWREDIPIHGLSLPLDSSAGRGTSMQGSGRPFIPGEDYQVISGDHRLNGLLLCRNPGQPPGGRLAHRATIMDVAPTVLYALGVPIPEEMDGKVLTALFGEGSFILRPPVLKKSAEAGRGLPKGEGDYDGKDEESIRQRLRSLGYLE